MSATTERDFSNFAFGDNVYELAAGVIPDVARRLDVEISDQPLSADLQSIMNKVGTNKVLRENQEVLAIDRDAMVGLVEQAGVQKRLNRSLLNPDIVASADTVDAFVVTGGMANWQDRTTTLVGDSFDRPVYSLAGQRLMDTTTEVPNPHVERLFGAFGRYPTEAQYAAGIVVPRLVSAGKNVLPSAYQTTNGDEIMTAFFQENPELLESRLALARVANSGVIMALQLRDAARQIRSDFDSDLENPQLFVMTDSFPVARTAAEESDPSKYQKPATALRQAVLVAKKLHEAADGE
jgi:hypothetical protein